MAMARHDVDVVCGTNHASRFARELVTQELGVLTLIKRDVRV
ncbi:hypothetical protein [Nitrobacter vulgaris]|nr:hypothetical protein [Nitrobacter vulgaris]